MADKDRDEGLRRAIAAAGGVRALALELGFPPIESFRLRRSRACPAKCCGRSFTESHALAGASATQTESGLQTNPG
jgi:hypothetical protein